MKIGVISNFTHTAGEEQGYQPLPLRLELIDDPVNGPETPAASSAWYPSKEDLERLLAGHPVILRVLGGQPPVLLWVGDFGDARPIPDPERRDIHRERAAEIYGVAYEEVTEEQRRAAKTQNFADAYTPSNPRTFGEAHAQQGDPEAARKLLELDFAEVERRWMEGGLCEGRGSFERAGSVTGRFPRADQPPYKTISVRFGDQLRAQMAHADVVMAELRRGLLDLGLRIEGDAVHVETEDQLTAVREIWDRVTSDKSQG